MNPASTSFTDASPLSAEHETKPEEGYLPSSVGELLSNPFSLSLEANEDIPSHECSHWNVDRQTTDRPFITGIPAAPSVTHSCDQLNMANSSLFANDQDERPRKKLHVGEGSGSITSTGGPSNGALILPPSPSCTKSVINTNNEKTIHDSCDPDTVSTSSKSTPRLEAGQGVEGKNSERVVRKQVRTRAKDMNPSLVHTCPTCGKKFAKKYNQKIHERRHQGDVPFVCDHENCGKGFMWRSSFERHLKTHGARPKSNDEDPTPSGAPDDDGPVACDVAEIKEPKTHSDVVINGVKFEVDHRCLQSITTAVSLCRLSHSDCTELLNIEIDGIRDAAENAIASRLQYVSKVKNSSVDLSDPNIEQLRRLIFRNQDRKPL